MDNEAPQTSVPEWFVPRSPSLLNLLAYEHRWEVTRRHPVYLAFWEVAAKHHASPSTDSVERRFGEIAQRCLEGIGAGAPWPSPLTPIEELMGTTFLGEKWVDGAVFPMTYRGLLNAIILDLPPECLREIGNLFVKVGHEDLTDPDARHAALSALVNFKHSAFETEVKRAVIGINPHAPSRLIQESLEKTVAAMKQRLGIPETRRREDKFDEYLTVWDAREGWWGNHYQVSKEWTLLEIAKEFKLSKSTVMNRYRSAFRLIFGCDFSPSLWVRVFGGFKLASITAGRRHRFERDRTTQEVPETRLGIEVTKDAADTQNSDPDLLPLDICELIRRGWDNSQIIKELELISDEANAIIDYYRHRLADDLFRTENEES